ncbi:MAG: sulfite exporter TauE/SafE family protein [Verrucomicrobiota bacterium]
MIGGAFAIGLNKGGLTGLGILPVLIFALVFHPRQSTGFVLPLLIVGDVCAVITYRRLVNWKVFFTLLPPGIAGVAAGYLLLGHIPETVFGPMIGWLILALIALHFIRGSLGEALDHIFQSRGFGVVMGVLAGVTTMIANAAGPVSTLYFIAVGLPKWDLIGTSSWFFFAINLTKVAPSAHLGAHQRRLGFAGRATGAGGGAGLLRRALARRRDAAESLRDFPAHLHGARRAAALGIGTVRAAS